MSHAQRHDRSRHKDTGADGLCALSGPQPAWGDGGRLRRTAGGRIWQRRGAVTPSPPSERGTCSQGVREVEPSSPGDDRGPCCGRAGKQTPTEPRGTEHKRVTAGLTDTTGGSGRAHWGQPAWRSNETVRRGGGLRYGRADSRCLGKGGGEVVRHRLGRAVLTACSQAATLPATRTRVTPSSQVTGPEKKLLRSPSGPSGPSGWLGRAWSPSWPVAGTARTHSDPEGLSLLRLRSCQGERSFGEPRGEAPGETAPQDGTAPQRLARVRKPRNRKVTGGG